MGKHDHNLLASAEMKHKDRVSKLFLPADQAESACVTIWNTSESNYMTSSMPIQIFKQGDGFILVFSLSVRETFDSIRHNLELISEHAAILVPIFLVGVHTGEKETIE